MLYEPYHLRPQIDKHRQILYHPLKDSLKRRRKVNVLFLITAILAAVWLIAIFITRYLMKQAQESMAKQYEMHEKKYTFENLGVSNELVKEAERAAEAGLYLEDPPPGFTERVLQKIREYEERLTKICDLKKDDVIKMGDMQHAFDHLFDDVPPEYHLFVVLEVTTIGRTGFFVEVVVRQLDEDGTYDPDGRKVLLSDNKNGEKKSSSSAR